MRTALGLGATAAALALGAALALPRLGSVVVFEVLLAVVGALALRFLLPTLGDGPRRARRRRWRRAPDQTPAPAWLLRYQGMVVGAGRDTAATESRLLPELRQLAAERLDALHDVDFTRQPEQARRLLGEAGWSLLRPDWASGRGTWDPGATPAQIEAAVAAIEKL
jgi:hypothetical protein